MSPRPSAYLAVRDNSSSGEIRHQTPPLTAGRAGARSWPLLRPLPGDASACARSPASRRERRGVGGWGAGSRAGAVRTRRGAARGRCGRSDCPLTPCPANSAAPCPWGTGEGRGEAFLGLRQKTCICLRAVTPDPGACPSVAGAGAPRSAPQSWRRRCRGPRPQGVRAAGCGPRCGRAVSLGAFLRNSSDFAVTF